MFEGIDSRHLCTVFTATKQMYEAVLRYTFECTKYLYFYIFVMFCRNNSKHVCMLFIATKQTYTAVSVLVE